jgi:hypothetical protein
MFYCRWEKVTASQCRSQGKTGTKAIKEMAGITIRIVFKLEDEKKDWKYPKPM